MKLWWLGLMLLIGGLVFVPTAYFAIILNDYPQPVNIVLFASWIVGVVAVPAGFLLLLVAAVRTRGTAGDDAGHSPDDEDARALALRGLALVLTGLLVVPLCYFAVTVYAPPPALRALLVVLGVLAWLALPCGVVMFLLSRSRHARALAPQGVRAAPGDAPERQDVTDLAGMLRALHAAGVLTADEYRAKSHTLGQR